MEARIAQIGRFIDTCTEIIEGKYTAADEKISEALAAIAASRDLTQLFTAVTQDFDYPAAKLRYLRPAVRGARGAAYLPADRSELLAYVFCLFAEIDAGTILLNDFLLRYFYVDGSYTAGFTLFAERVVRPFRDIVRDCFPAVCSGSAEDRRRAQEACIGQIAALLPAERERLALLPLKEEERAAAELIGAGLAGAAAKKDAVELSALLAGYRYFLRTIRGECDSSAQIFLLAAQL